MKKMLSVMLPILYPFIVLFFVSGGILQIGEKEILLRDRCDEFYGRTFVELNKDCWVRALKYYNTIKKDKNIIDAKMLVADVRMEGRGFSVKSETHAIIATAERRKNGEIEMIFYDPTSGRYLKHGDLAPIKNAGDK